jgi:hypothetical protein
MPSELEIRAQVHAILESVDWDSITQEPAMLSCEGTVFKVDLPASLKDASVPDMTLAPHPDDFYTIEHAKQVLNRMQVSLFMGVQSNRVTNSPNENICGVQ